MTIERLEQIKGYVSLPASESGIECALNRCFCEELIKDNLRLRGELNAIQKSAREAQDG